MTPRTTQARFEPLGRLWQQSWLDDVARGGPLVFADWLATLPRSIESAGRAAWRIDLAVLDLVSGSGEMPVVVAPEAGGRCLGADAVALVEAVLAGLRARECPMVEVVRLLDAAVAELADADDWPVPPALRGTLEVLASDLAARLDATGAAVREPERLLAVPSEAAAPTGAFDLDRVAAVCLAVPGGVVAATRAQGASS